MPDLYSVAILDVKMPEINGFELYEKIRVADNKVKVIFLTALTELQDYEEFRSKLFSKSEEKYFFLQKPIENQDLVERVSMMMRMNSNIH